MVDIIDFRGEKDKREIDGSCYCIMPDGSRWYKFSAEYEVAAEDTCQAVGLPEYILRDPSVKYPSPRFSVEFYARDFEHAKRLVEFMKVGLNISGQIYKEMTL